MTDDRTAPALDAPLPHAAEELLLDAPASPPRGLSRRALAALIAGSALLHAGLLAFAAYESRDWDARHPVVEVIDFHATSTPGAGDDHEVSWESQGGAHRARITLSGM